MASGIFGQADLLATTNTTVYTVPVDTLSTFNVSICNRTNAAVAVRLALATLDAPTDGEWVEYDTSIPANGVLERTGFIAQAAKKVVAYASAAGVSVSIYGIED